MCNVVNSKNTHSARRYNDKNNENDFEGLNESAKAFQENAANRIVHDIGKGTKTKSNIRLNGYTSANDTVEPPNHISHHFITEIGAGYDGKRA